MRCRRRRGWNCGSNGGTPARQLLNQFGLTGVAALSNDQTASCDEHRLAHELLSTAVRHGAQVFDRTQVMDFDCSGNGVTLTKSRDVKVVAKHVDVWYFARSEPWLLSSMSFTPEPEATAVVAVASGPRETTPSSRRGV